MASLDGAAFRAKIRADGAAVEQKMVRVVQVFAVELGQNIVVGGEVSPGTPVDTGNARGAWVLSVGAPDEGVTSGIGRDPMALGTRAVGAMRLGDWLFWTNVVRYVPVLEYLFWSKQAPRGFVRLAIAARQQLADKAARFVFGR